MSLRTCSHGCYRSHTLREGIADYRLVKYLPESKELETFWKLYASEDLEIDIKNLYGFDRKEAVEAALGME
jgi:hypothetical protein